MTHDSLTFKFKLTLENIENIAPETPGAIILYDKQGKINQLKIAEESIKNDLLLIFKNKTSSYFSFKETKVYSNISSIVLV